MKMEMFAILDRAKSHTENMSSELGGGHVYDRSSVLDHYW
jgi:hypothetical protein